MVIPHAAARVVTLGGDPRPRPLTRGAAALAPQVAAVLGARPTAA